MQPADLRRAFEDVAFTTPAVFTDDAEAVDHDALADHLAALGEAGANLFIPNGNTGEYYSLTDEERIAVVETHVAATPEDVTVAAGAGGSLGEVRELAAAYEEAGADALMVMHPGHTYVHREGLKEYYHRICDATDLGVVIYKRGPTIDRDLLVELSQREEVVAVKFAVNDVKEFTQTMEDAPGDVTWVNGIAERFAVPYAIQGATGFTTGIGNFVPRAVLALQEAIEAENWERAREIQSALRPLEDLREEPGANNNLGAANNVPVVKRGLELAGRTGGPVRPPIVGLTDEGEQRLEEYYEAVAGRFD